jgi:hypothetical protein
MRPLESLTLESVIATLLAAFRKIDDNRDPAKVKYALSDALMSGFTMLFFHHPSLLQYQDRMKQKRGLCNLETIFQVKSIPSDTQMREILDGVQPEFLRAMLKSPSTYLGLGLLAAAAVRGRFQFDWRSPKLLFGIYFLVASALAFVTSARGGAYINYYLEATIALSICAGMTWHTLSRRFVPAAFLVIVALYGLAGAFEFHRQRKSHTRLYPIPARKAGWDWIKSS